MENFRYGKELVNSFTEVFKKPILLMPFVYIFVLSTIFLFITPTLPNYGPTDIIDMGLVSWVIGLTLIQLLIGLVFNAMALSSFKLYNDHEKITCGNQAFQGCKLYWKLLLLRIYQIIIVLIPLVVLIAIYFSIYSVNVPVANIIGIFLLILYLIYLLVLLFLLMFSNIIIAYDGKGAKDALIESYDYFKKNSAHVFFTIVALIVYFLIFAVFVILLMFLVMLLVQSESIDIWRSIVISLISIPVSAAAVLYLFKAFTNAPNIFIEKKIKKTQTTTAVNIDAKKSIVSRDKKTMKKKAVKK
ncbi:MAG: hypothetical protein WC758_02730 [Candidatus Woesearchaeota archaeon]|jgi:hypothetical protein